MIDENSKSARHDVLGVAVRGHLLAPMQVAYSAASAGKGTHHNEYKVGRYALWVLLQCLDVIGVRGMMYTSVVGIDLPSPDQVLCITTGDNPFKYPCPSLSTANAFN